MNDRPVILAEINAIHQVIAAQRQNPFVVRRQHRNVENPPQEFRREEFWKQMVVCMCTSVQPSGPKSRVSKFVREKPFPLNLPTCESDSNLRANAETTLHTRGLRFGPKIAHQIEKNLAWLRNTGWEIVTAQFSAVTCLPVGSPSNVRIAAERTAARRLMGSKGGLSGFGPKQARNLWQCMGVTQYEIPLDSRICAWINALPSAFRVEPSRLYSSVPYYEEIMSQIQAICDAAGVLPCEFDAAVFASVDTEEWPENDDVF